MHLCHCSTPYGICAWIAWCCVCITISWSHTKLFYFFNIHFAITRITPIHTNDVCAVNYSHICGYYVTLVFMWILLMYCICTFLPVFI